MKLEEVRQLQVWLEELIAVSSDSSETAKIQAFIKKLEPIRACPWCQSVCPPVSNNESDGQHRKVNPLKCPECDGVGGYEDWRLE